MKVYLAGPMTGYPKLNHPLFHAVAARLRRLGLHVVNPAEIVKDHTTPWADCLRMDIPHLVTCEALVLLDGWDRSRGARLERTIAAGLGMPVWLFKTDAAGAAVLKRFS